MQFIKCSNNDICEVSSIEVNNKAMLKLNLNIKSYQSMENGWKERKFPEEVLPSIKDKLIFDNNKIYEVLYILDTFINTGDIVLENTTYTNRGFSMIDLKDNLENKISIQKSSTMSEDELWFGTRVNKSEIGEIKDGKFIPYKYSSSDVLISDRLLLTIEEAKKLRMAMLNQMSMKWSSHDIADFIDKKTENGNNMVIDIWSNLTPTVQRINFMYACGLGNIDLVKKIYKHPDNKFLNELYCTFEEFGLQMSMQPESKKILKFFKIMMKEKEIDLSVTMEKWIRDNKLGRKIRIK